MKNYDLIQARNGTIPQFEGQDGQPKAVTGDHGPYYQLVDVNGNPLFSENNPAHVQLTGRKAKVIQYGEELVIPPGVTVYVPSISESPDVLDKRYAVAINLTGVGTPDRKFGVFLNYRRYNEGVKDGDARYLMAVETVITATGESGTPTRFVSPLNFVPAEWFNVGIINNADVDITLNWYIAEV